MSRLSALIKRNTKLFFKDKGIFFTSLITPLILLVLYATFLGRVYRESFQASLPEGIELGKKLLNGLVSGQLCSSLLAVSCVTVAFCANMLMVQDKVSGARKDLTITPVKSYTLSISYYVSAALATLIICLTAAGACFLYMANTGWYLSGSDVALLLLDVALLSLFGTALSSVINFFLSTQGQISAVGTIVSSGYGFICGAYMPISQFGAGLQKVLSFLPGTYATSLIRNHAMRGAFAAMEELHFPAEAIDGMKKAVDCTPEFFGHAVSEPAMFLILGGSAAFLILLYIAMNILKKK